MKGKRFSRELRGVVLCIIIVCLASCGSDLQNSDTGTWQQAGERIRTRWAADIDVNSVHAEYPRPQMKREAWENLNGLWEYAILPKEKQEAETFEGKILVPFAVESSLSGVGRTVGVDNRIWYRRSFKVARKWKKGLVFLNFEAVDWEAKVWVNGREVGTHRGGYDPFSFDITPFLKSKGPQELVVSVWDPVDSGFQPRGKQVSKPRGIWYTSVSGIWRSVWLEPRPSTHIQSLNTISDIDRGELVCDVHLSGPHEGATLKLEIFDGDTRISQVERSVLTGAIPLPDARLWSPEDPFLYGLKVTLRDARGRDLDKIDAYFGMRKISLAKGEDGLTRLFLNNRFLFQFGPLDQGWWPDGLYTAPSDEALRYDVEMTRKMGYNMLRKHVKVEPRRFYYWCDKLGVLVWQDMPSGDRYIGSRDEDISRTAESAAQFKNEFRAVVESYFNHPSIIIWVPFNEGWGQYDTAGVVDWLKMIDPHRLVINASGWADRGVGDIRDVHAYPGPACPPAEEKRAIVLGEFGGLGLPVSGHTWQDEKNWGYRSYQDPDQLFDAYRNLITNLRPLITDGLSAAVYTQTSDVEIEVNGLMTYDRDRVKMGEERLAEVNQTVYLPAPQLIDIAATSKHTPQVWRYSFSASAGGWFSEGFDDTGWRSGSGGFGKIETPNARIGTTWETADIWLRRSFDHGGEGIQNFYLYLHHDEDAEVYLNGILLAKVAGYSQGYRLIQLDDTMSSHLKAGKNLLAVHCHQTRGGQYIDVGLAQLVDPPPDK